MLNIVKSSEPIKVDRLKILIYGDPGGGKSSLGFTAKLPILLDFDKGSHRAKNRKDIIRIDNWDDAAAILDAEEELKEYHTIVIDTVGRMIDYLIEDIITNSPKAARRDGNLTQNGYGTLKFRFQSFVKRVSMLGKDLVLIAHDKEDRDGDEIIVRPDMTTSAYQFVKKAVDMMGNLHFEQGRRVLNFNPTDKYVGKNCIKMKAVFIPEDVDNDGLLNPEFDHFLERLIDNVRDTLNNESGEQQEANKIYREFSEKIKTAKKPSEFDEIGQEISGITFDHIKRILGTQMKTKIAELGIKYYRELGRFRFVSDDNDEKEKSSADKNTEKAESSVAATAEKVAEEAPLDEPTPEEVEDMAAAAENTESTEEPATEPTEEQIEDEAIEEMAAAEANPESIKEPEEPKIEEPTEESSSEDNPAEPEESETAEEKNGYVMLSYLDLEKGMKDKSIREIDVETAKQGVLKGKMVFCVQIESDGETITKYAIKVQKRAKKEVNA